MKCSESIKELATALSKAQGELDKAKKSSKNPHFRSTYASLEEVIDACREALSSNGLSVVQSVGSAEDFHPTLTTVLLHSSGEYLENTVRLPVTKPGPQELGSCLTYLKRYSLAALVGVADSDDDAETAEGRVRQAQSAHPTQVPGQLPKAQPKPITDDFQAPSTTAAEVYRAPAGNYVPKGLSQKQVDRMYAIAKKSKWSVQLVQSEVKKKYNKQPMDLSRKEYDEAVDFFQMTVCPESGETPWTPASGSVLDQFEKQKKSGYVDHTTRFVPGPDTNDDIPF
jgi:hypothetical protein